MLTVCRRCGEGIEINDTYEEIIGVYKNNMDGHGDGSWDILCRSCGHEYDDLFEEFLRMEK